jgi:hypothetical protein
MTLATTIFIYKAELYFCRLTRRFPKGSLWDKLTELAHCKIHGEHRFSTDSKVVSMNSVRWVHYGNYQRRNLLVRRLVGRSAGPLGGNKNLFI